MTPEAICPECGAIWTDAYESSPPLVVCHCGHTFEPDWRSEAEKDRDDGFDYVAGASATEQDGNPDVAGFGR